MLEFKDDSFITVSYDSKEFEVLDFEFKRLNKIKIDFLSNGIKYFTIENIRIFHWYEGYRRIKREDILYW